MYQYLMTLALLIFVFIYGINNLHNYEIACIETDFYQRLH